MILNLKPTGDLARWEAAHPFNREDRVDPILAFRIRERRRHRDDDDATHSTPLNMNMLINSDLN